VGSLNVPAMEAALTDVVRRHESLRTIFTDRSGEAYQEILPSDTVHLELRRRQLNTQEIATVLAHSAAAGIDVSCEIPLRASLFALSAHEHVLLLLIHHIAADGWSLHPLLRDLSHYYAARRDGRTAELPALPVQYADYTLWQRKVLGDDNHPESTIGGQLAVWREYLSGLPEAIELPADRPRPAVTSHCGESVELSIEAALHRELVTLAREQGASLFMVVQAGLAALLTRLGAGDDIPIGSPVAGRTDSALDDLVGFFVNTLVLRTD